MAHATEHEDGDGPTEVTSLADVDHIVDEHPDALLVSFDIDGTMVFGDPPGGITVEMVLDVQSITVGGRRYLVGTSELTEDSDGSIGASRRAVGTIIGAIPVGGTGATTQVLTKGRDVTVPAETLLRFRLDKPVTLRAEQ